MVRSCVGTGIQGANLMHVFHYKIVAVNENQKALTRVCQGWSVRRRNTPYAELGIRDTLPGSE